MFKLKQPCQNNKITSVIKEMKNFKKKFFSIILISLIMIFGLLFYFIILEVNFTKNSEFRKILPRQENYSINAEIWSINSTTYHNQTVKIINESILIEDNGILIINWNGTILMNSTTEYDYNITIKDNGKLILNNGSIKNINKTKIYLKDNASIIAYNNSKIALTSINSTGNSTLNFNDSIILLEEIFFFGYNFQLNNSFLNVTYNGTSNTITLIKTIEDIIFYNSNIFSLGNTAGFQGLNSNFTLVCNKNLDIELTRMSILGGAAGTGGDPLSGNSYVNFYGNNLFLKNSALNSTGKKIYGRGSSSNVILHSNNNLEAINSSIYSVGLTSTNFQHSGNSKVIILTETSQFENFFLLLEGGDGVTIYSSGGEANLTVNSDISLKLINTDILINGGNGLIGFEPSNGGHGYLFLRSNVIQINKSFLNCTPGLKYSSSSNNGNLSFHLTGNLTLFNMQNEDILINNSIDYDLDGLSNLIELNDSKTDPFLLDTDGDLLNDSAEYQFYGTDPLKNDTDDDNLDDYEELIIYRSSPFLLDSDFDKISDYDEVKIWFTNPNLPDSDFDYLTDYDEIFLYKTDPNDYDTDNDGLSDFFDFFKLLPIDIPIFILIVVGSATSVLIRYKRTKNKYKIFQSNIKDFKSNLNNYYLIFNKHTNDLEILNENLNQISKNYIFRNNNEENLIIEYRLFKKFIGINEILEDLEVVLNKIVLYLDELNKKYRKVGFEEDFKKDFEQLENLKKKKDEEIAFFLKNLRHIFIKTFYLSDYDKLKADVQSYQISEFEFQFKKFIIFFENKYEDINKNLEDWLSTNVLSQINEEIKILELSFSEIEIWFQNASNWANNLKIPKGYGFHLQLSDKWSIYFQKKDEFKAKILILKEIIQKSIRLTRDFISWNIVLINDNKNKLNKDIRNKIFTKLKNIDVEILDIDELLKVDIENLKQVTLNENKKMQLFFKSHDSYPIEDLIIEWNENFEEFIRILDDIKKEIKNNYKYLARFIIINKALFNYIEYKINAHIINYEDYVQKNRDRIGFKLINKFINEKSSKIKRKIEEFERYYINLCNNLPFILSEISISFFIFDWESHKEKIETSLNQFISKKFQFKCDIMQEYLDPYKKEIWECSNCGAISCNEHLEKWYLKKGTPQCFKCGQIGSFSKKKIEGISLTPKSKKSVKKEWIELLSCKYCGKVLKVLSFKLLNNKNLEIKTTCEDHLEIKDLILPKNLSSEWIGIVESNLNEEIRPLFYKIKEIFFKEDD
ncbi:MAG: hypothetical protein EAX96_15920 [Candidatus Lokiarchaeota archaeon]|nr:hypothetical protein [Candidatus Lokiarchaeota archaeon]